MSEVLVSIITPVYNAEKFIANTVDSVLAQTVDKWELILAENGSKDGTKKVLEELRQKDSRIKVMYLGDNVGAAKARNAGIKKASGRYIAFLDADDLWSPVFLEEMAGLIHRFPDALCWGFNYSVIKDRKTLALEQEGDSGYIDSEWRFSYFPFCSSSCCCRKSSLIELGGFDERMMYGEDLDMWFRLLLVGRGVMDTRIMAYYNQDVTDSLMQKRIPLEKHLPFFIDKYADARKNNEDFRQQQLLEQKGK